MTRLTPDDLTAIDRLRPGLAPIRALAHEIAVASGIPADKILGRGRKGRVAEARQILMFAAYRNGVSVADIKSALGLHETTVRHGIAAERARRGYKGEGPPE